MIISHTHKFIFIKTIKTASSSMEIALSEVLGPDDIITAARADLGQERAKAQDGQNWRLDHPLVPKRPLLKRLLRRPERHYHPSVGYYEHMPAWRVKAYIGDEIWDSYYKFAFERNPWDRQVSFYFYKTRGKEVRPSFEDFLTRRKPRALVENYDLYTIDGKMALDFVGRYEKLDSDFQTAMTAIGLSDVTLPFANAGSKPKSQSYRDFYTDDTRTMVADWYQPEIKAFNYTF